MALAEVVFEVAAPGALGAFTREHQGARAVVRFVALGQPDARALVTVAAPTEGSAPLVRALRDEAGGAEFEVASVTPYSVVLKAGLGHGLAHWARPALRVMEVFGPDTLVEPAVVEHGRLRMRAVVVAALDTRRALEKLQELQRTGGFEGFRVVRVGELDPRDLAGRTAALLDPEQEELVRLALLMGYYDTPRRCNLEDIAARVGLSVSPVHKKLKEVEHVLIRAHLDPGAPPPARRRRAPRRGPPMPPGAMREVLVRIAAPAFLPCAFTAKHPATRVVYQPLPDVPGAAGSALLVALAGPAEAGAFLAAAKADAALAEVQLVSRDREHLSLRVRRAPPPAGPGAPPSGSPDAALDPLPAFAAALGRDAYLKPAVCEGGAVLGRLVVLRTLDAEELASMLQELAHAGAWTEAELVRVRDASMEGALAAQTRPERLTDRQEEVLRIANALGYYRTPRGCTLESVAATLGISANAVHKSLTAAEQRIIQTHVGAG